MSRIIGVTVGTPTSPSKMEEELKIFVAQNSDTVTWDGNTEGHTVVDYPSLGGSTDRFVRVSDATPTMADIPEEGISGTEIEFGVFGEWHTPKEELATDHTGIMACGRFLSVSEEAVGTEFSWQVSTGANPQFVQIVFPKAGLYFQSVGNGDGCRSLTIPGYTGFVTKKIDPALLPDVCKLDFGKFTGKLLYVDANGNVAPLSLGAGLAIVDGVLTIDPGIVENVRTLRSSDGYVLKDSNRLYIKAKEVM